MGYLYYNPANFTTDIVDKNPEAFTDIADQDIDGQREWSDRTFGPGKRTEGVLKHIAKELEEVRQKPDDISEWVDIMILAIDGATRAGFTGAEVTQAYHRKMIENHGREWPDWHDFSEDEPIEHIRGVS